MTTVPLLIQQFKAAPLGTQRWSLAALNLHEALMADAAIVTPASERVDVEKVRAVIAEMKKHLADGFVPYLYEVGNWADELARVMPEVEGE